jgi:diguanylate cyclase (GGDEF)-like protein
MNSRWILFALVLVTNAFLALFLAILLRRKPAAPGRTSMIWMLVMLAVWAFGYAMITISPSLEDKYQWLKFENIGILTVPVFWFFFTLRYTQQDRWLNKFTGALFFFIPAVALALLFNPNWFHFFYVSIHPVTEHGGPLVIERGPWYFASLVQSYLLNLIGMGLLIWRFVQFKDVFRRQVFVLIGAVLIPLLVNIFYQLAPRFIPAFSVPIDLTPISFTVTAFLLSTGIFGLRLFDLVPIARHIVLEHIPEMVFVVDALDRVLDANTVAQKTLGKSLDQIVGGDVIDVFREWPDLINRFLTTHETHEEILIPGDPPHTLEIIVSALYNRFKQLDGRIIVAHDISERKWLENDLKYANDSLKTQLVEIERLRAELQEQAIRDPLTNVFNRRYMAEFLDQKLASAEREDVAVSVVIMDMDNFKQFNDTYGHKCGDVVLRAFADFLVEHTRRGDVVCRYGGEEFVIIMPGASLDAGYERAENWRQDFSETNIAYEDMKFSATFSAGVAVFPQDAVTGDMLLQAADRALYRSKNNGRNRVTKYNAQ